MSKNQKSINLGGSSGAINPFARSGLMRSPTRRSEESGAGSLRSSSVGAPVHSTASQPVEVMDGAWLLRAISQEVGKGRPALEVAEHQLGKIIDFATTKSNISKDLKTALLRLRVSVDEAKQEHAVALLAATAAEPAKENVSKFTQTEAFSFAGSPRSEEANARDKRDKHSQKRARQPSGEELSGGARKARRIITPKAGGNAGKSDPSQGSRKAGKGGPEKAGPSRNDGNKGLRPMVGPQQPQSRAVQGEDPPWTKVERKKKKKVNPQVEVQDAKPRRRKAGARREKGDAIVIKTEQSKYSDVLKTMRSDAKLEGLGADVRSIRRTRTGEMILELKRQKEHKGAAYKRLAEKVLGEGVQVRALTHEATLKVKDIDEITEVEELVTALRQQCDVQVAAAAVKLRRGPAGTQIALVQLPVADVKKSVKVGSIKVGWCVCHLTFHEPPEVCFRCLEPGHKSWDCKGPDRRKLCRRCGAEGHKAQSCTSPPICMICTGKTSKNRHAMGGPGCPAFKKAAVSNKSQCR
ncbi:uncharacterized protein LOC134285639 [Aedes albopictus]|uniref:CCHC-type domain-containing protein n=1 Tax=Aedes albopictus TaxID=7160 RepID=A0ABM1ZXS3_AEDAL